MPAPLVARLFEVWAGRPAADSPAFDYSAYWARTGFMDTLHEPDAPPAFQRPGMGDHSGSLTLNKRHSLAADGMTAAATGTTFAEIAFAFRISGTSLVVGNGARCPDGYRGRRAARDACGTDADHVGAERRLKLFWPEPKPLLLFGQFDVLRRHPTKFPVAPLDHRVASFLVALARFPHCLDQGRVNWGPVGEGTINRVELVILHTAPPLFVPWTSRLRSALPRRRRVACGS